MRVHRLAPRKPSGFTLIEIMVVIVILGILAALVVPKVMGRPDEARVIAAKQDIASLLQALKLYRLDNINYPTTDQGLQALVRSCFAAITRASSGRPITLGTTNAASMPRMTTTIMISIKVKPECFRGVKRCNEFSI